MASKQTKEIKVGTLLEKVLSVIETEIDSLPETLEGVAPDKRLDFISRTLPLLIKFREVGEDNWRPLP